MNIALGIDVGGSGIKGMRVDLDKGELVDERIRIPTPQPATPEAVIGTIAEIVSKCDCLGPIGCAFPAVVKDGVVHNATNIDKSWINLDAGKSLEQRLDQRVHMINDADAAGLAEMHFGAGVPHRVKGVVLMLAFGTGIGSSIFVNGQLLPNTEFGELELDGHIAEQNAAARLREEGLISWDDWIARVQRYLSHVDMLVTPDLIIFGGGISKEHHKFLPQLKTRAKLQPAKLLGNAGIVGAALTAMTASKMPAS